MPLSHKQFDCGALYTWCSQRKQESRFRHLAT
jgi:hypothetical protein